jgi:hypothetical protein
VTNHAVKLALHAGIEAVTEAEIAAVAAVAEADVRTMVEAGVVDAVAAAGAVADTAAVAAVEDTKPNARQSSVVGLQVSGFRRGCLLGR